MPASQTLSAALASLNLIGRPSYRRADNPTPSPGLPNDDDEDIPYFVATLGQAKILNQKLPAAEAAKFRGEVSITKLIDNRAELYPNHPVVGTCIPDLAYREWRSQCFTFKDLQLGSSALACHYLSTGQLSPILAPPTRAAPKTVALLCSSGIELLFHWLALIRLGYTVFLLAPQLSTREIVALLKSAKCSTLFYNRGYASLVTVDGKLKDNGIQAIEMLLDYNIYINPSPKASYTGPHFDIDPEEPAYFHHSSGTSKGCPKPIPQSHSQATRCQLKPQQESVHNEATLTTTPLYHGGLADLMRGLNSNNMTWLYPPSVPLTVTGVMRMLDAADKAQACFTDGIQETSYSKTVGYLSCVPYVLTMMNEDMSAVERLANLEMVGIGGAPLDKQLGDKFVEVGVRLVSRFGMTETGFLLSSYRDFHVDPDWEYLRCHATFGGADLAFEPQGRTSEGKYELIVGPKWPHMAKRNRPNGSYATSDVFELKWSASSALESKWMYVGRKDSLLVLLNGKKFDPVPIEDALQYHPLVKRIVRECLVFGQNRLAPGVLVFTKESCSREECRRLVYEVVKKVNEESPSHARIPISLVQFMNPSCGQLPRSSKGSLIRAKANEQFEAIIGSAYSSKGDISPENNETDTSEPTSSSSVHVVVRATVKGAILANGKPEDQRQRMAERLTDETDLFSFGIDSVMAAEIRGEVQNRFKFNPPLPINVVYEHITIKGLTDFILNGRKPELVPDHPVIMNKMVEKYAYNRDVFSQELLDSDCSERGRGDAAVLTGATGSLGAHILYQLCLSSTLSKIYCMVRASDRDSATERVMKGLGDRGLSIPDSRMADVVCLPAVLEENHCGLKEDMYNEIKNRVGLVIHSAWPVNFLAPLQSFEPQFQGLHNLLNFTTSPGSTPLSPIFLFISSLASISQNRGTLNLKTTTLTIPETCSSIPSDASSLGYAQSKWVAEAICNSIPNSNNVKIIRVGQLCGDTQSGIWNETEAWPLMFAVSDYFEGRCPDITEEVHLLPVDLAARQVLEIADAQWPVLRGKPRAIQARREGGDGVYHVCNPRSVSFRTLTLWLGDVYRRSRFEVVEVGAWLDMVEGEGERMERGEMKGDRRVLGAKKLVGLWRRNYDIPTSETLSPPSHMLKQSQASTAATPSPTPPNSNSPSPACSSQLPQYAITNTLRASQTMRDMCEERAEPVVGRELWGRIVGRWVQTGFLRGKTAREGRVGDGEAEGEGNVVSAKEKGEDTS